MGLNIYVADTKNKKQLRLKTFEGLSLGEARGFLYDLCARDVKKNDYSAVMRTLAGKLESSALTASEKEAKTEELKGQIESIIYDQVSIHELLTTVWNFSDKTAIIVRA